MNQCKLNFDPTQSPKHLCGGDMSKADKWPREYERVPGLDEVSRDDFVAYTKAKHQAARDR